MVVNIKQLKVKNWMRFADIPRKAWERRAPARHGADERAAGAAQQPPRRSPATCHAIEATADAADSRCALFDVRSSVLNVQCSMFAFAHSRTRALAHSRIRAFQNPAIAGPAKLANAWH